MKDTVQATEGMEKVVMNEPRRLRWVLCDQRGWHRCVTVLDSRVHSTERLSVTGIVRG